MSTPTPANPPANPPPEQPPASSSVDDDALFASLENEDDSAYRSQRIEQLNADLASAKAQQPSTATVYHTSENNLYPTLTTDQSVLETTTQAHRCVLHFAHPDFTRCAVMDEHLRQLASRHYEVRFARVDVRDTPFVVEKLNIRVLPCVVGFKDGVGVERVLGFEGLGSGGKDGADQISSVVLEKRLLWKGVLVREVVGGRDGEREGEESGSESESDEDVSRGGARKAIRTGNMRYKDGEDDDDDWD